MLEILGGRKFLFMIILLVIGLVIDLTTVRGLSDSFKELMVYLAAIYTAGNGVVHISKVFKRPEIIPEITLEPKQADNNGVLEAVLNTVQLNTKGIAEILNRIGGKNV